MQKRIKTAEAKAAERKLKSAVMWKQKAREIRQRRGKKWDVVASCCQSLFQHTHIRTHTLFQHDSLHYLKNKASR